MLDLSLEFATVHLAFHISILSKYVGDPNTIVPLDDVSVHKSLTCTEVWVEIVDR